MQFDVLSSPAVILHGRLLSACSLPDVRRRARIVKLLMFTGPAAFLFEAYAIVITLVIMIQVSGQPLDGPSDIFSILSYDGFRRVVVILSAFPFIFILPGQLGVEIGGVPEMYSTRLVNRE